MRIRGRCITGTHDILLMTLDTLRYDVAVSALREGRTPHLASILPNGTWELRHTPGNFTFSAHQAFFAGFLPTPVSPGPHPRLLALAFAGSETIDDDTLVLDGPDIVTALRRAGYYTICIGGVGFFNKQTPLSSVLPSLFAESHWSPEFGVTSDRSTELQVKLACERIASVSADQRLFLFINISALHEPKDVETQKTALQYVDAQLPPLLAAMRKRGPWLAIFCSDHGTAYGEGGYRGHRVAHEVVWNVPYAEMIL